MKTVIIIGTGFAGYTVAREFRKLDKTSKLVMITSDDGSSYPKPMLSNALAKGKSAGDLVMSDANAMAKTLDAEIITHTLVTSIDPDAQTVSFADHVRKYTSLVLAVGASPIHLSFEGDAAEDVLSINDIDDYSVFRQKLLAAKRVALIGPGLIGCEFANDLIKAGFSVAVIGPDSHPISTLLPPPIGLELQQSLAGAGVEWHLGTTTIAINHQQNGYQLSLASGRDVYADIVVSAVGLRPNVSLAKATNIEVNRGIMTNKSLQTSKVNIYAIGDCAEVSTHNLLFIAPILIAARALAQTLSGNKTTVHYPAMPVAIKTPHYPLVVAPPARDAIGEWQFVSAPSGFGINGQFVSPSNELLGFALSGDMVSEKQSLTKRLPDLLS